MRFLSFFALLFAAPVLIAASQPLVLEPSSQWVLDYGDDSCRLLRTFGADKDKATIVFEKSSPRSPMSLLIVGPAVQVSDDARDSTGEFQPVERSTFKDGVSVKSTETHHDAILWRNVSFADPAMFPELKDRKDPESADLVRIQLNRDAILQSVNGRATQVESIAILPRHHRALELKSGTMGEAMKMMNQCTRDELAGWGIDPKIDDKIAVPARPIGMLNWIGPDDYPMEAVMRGLESSFQFRVNVDASGRVTDCHIATSVQAPEINDRICEKIKARARFKPAELADGTKVPDYFSNTMVFQVR